MGNKNVRYFVFTTLANFSILFLLWKLLSSRKKNVIVDVGVVVFHFNIAQFVGKGWVRCLEVEMQFATIVDLKILVVNNYG